MTQYTLTGPAQYEEEVRRSRFLVRADHVATPEDALARLEAWRVPDATHNCWAYQIGDAYRFHDDGEPGGTAGRPILQAIQGQACDQVMVVVTRWFGGTKLGTGGLMRAYGGAAAQCLRLANKRPIVHEVQLRCHCPFPDLTRVRSRFPEVGARVLDETFDAAGVCWTLAVPKDAVAEFTRQFTDQTRGQGRIYAAPGTGDGPAAGAERDTGGSRPTGS